MAKDLLLVLITFLRYHGNKPFTVLTQLAIFYFYQLVAPGYIYSQETLYLYIR